MSDCSTCTSSAPDERDESKKHLPAGCKGNGDCVETGCGKKTVYDWLSDMAEPSSDRFDILEVSFKGAKKEFYRNKHKLELHTGDAVVVESNNGYHIGYVALQGELVRLQLRKKQQENTEELPSVIRIANVKDQIKWEDIKKREMPTLYRTREIINSLGLSMKLSDVEYQADNSKATFYYSADDRVDFRELIKLLAGEFRVRVEMRQISLRQEAGRLGGIGSCGRELCCSTWLTEFKSVSTVAARYQNLSLNPSKLSGQCGRLKCCLNYELDTYLEALEHIPKLEEPLSTKKGEAKLQKTDIFKKIMWFGYDNENSWHAVPIERVNEILELNKKNIKPETLLVNKDTEREAKVQAISNQLEFMDKKYSQEKKAQNGPRKKPSPNRKSRVTSNSKNPKFRKDRNSQQNQQNSKKQQVENKKNTPSPRVQVNQNTKPTQAKKSSNTQPQIKPELENKGVKPRRDVKPKVFEKRKFNNNNRNNDKKN